MTYIAFVTSLVTSAGSPPILSMTSEEHMDSSPRPPESKGNDSAYIDDLKRHKGADADQPHRIKYTPLICK